MTRGRQAVFHWCQADLSINPYRSLEVLSLQKGMYSSYDKLCPFKLVQEKSLILNMGQ